VDRAGVSERDPVDLTAWRAELVDLLGELVAELGRLRVAVEVLAGASPSPSTPEQP
jgi:hypothetical protein